MTNDDEIAFRAAITRGEFATLSHNCRARLELTLRRVSAAPTFKNELRVCAARSRRRNSVGRTRVGWSAMGISTRMHGNRIDHRGLSVPA